MAPALIRAWPSPRWPAIVVLVAGAAACAAFLVGRYEIAPGTVIRILVGLVLPLDQDWSETDATIVVQIRLPRVLLALMVGASLAASGAAFQGMFRNPLVSSDILGVSAGAGFGAALAIVLSGDPGIVQLSAFFFATVAVGMTYVLSRTAGMPLLVLVLSGLIVTALFSALIALMTFVADPYRQLPSIVFWLMGSLSASSLGDVLSSAPGMFGGVALLLLVRWRLNVVSLGDEEARSVGVNPAAMKLIVISSASLATACAVSVSGIVGWIGLLVPHAARMLAGPDHRSLLPMSLVIGGTFLLVVDTVARTLTTAEIPLGVLTALVGAPAFAYLLRRTAGH